MAYSKQTWDTSSYVNPTRMNHIEEGIEEVSDSLDNLDADHVPYSSGVSVKQKIDWTLLGSFQIFDGQTKQGDWDLTNNVPASCNEICFYVTLGGGSVGNMPRNSIVIPFSIFSNYGVIYDFSLGGVRIYFNIERTNDSKFKISGVTISGTYSSSTYVYAYAR